VSVINTEIFLLWLEILIFLYQGDFRTCAETELFLYRNQTCNSYQVFAAAFWIPYCNRNWKHFKWMGIAIPTWQIGKFIRTWRKPRKQLCLYFRDSSNIFLTCYNILMYWDLKLKFSPVTMMLDFLLKNLYSNLDWGFYFFFLKPARWLLFINQVIENFQVAVFA